MERFIGGAPNDAAQHGQLKTEGNIAVHGKHNQMEDPALPMTPTVMSKVRRTIPFFDF